MQCRLDSPEALELFAGSAVAQGLKNKTNQAEFIHTHLKTQICTLKKVFATVNGWKAIIDQPDQCDMCSETDIFHLRLKARYMYAVLAHALNIYDHSDNTQLQPTFQHICELAIESVDHPLDKLYKGFSYTPHKKTYYMDNHEKPENVLYCSKFIDRYFSYELCAHRWLLVPEAKVLKMKSDGELSNKKGYKVEKTMRLTMNNT
jgi:hypothetical protein